MQSKISEFCDQPVKFYMREDQNISNSYQIRP
jgi:hypothetical protein